MIWPNSRPPSFIIGLTGTDIHPPPSPRGSSRMPIWSAGTTGILSLWLIPMTVWSLWISRSTLLIPTCLGISPGWWRTSTRWFGLTIIRSFLKFLANMLGFRKKVSVLAGSRGIISTRIMVLASLTWTTSSLQRHMMSSARMDCCVHGRMRGHISSTWITSVPQRPRKKLFITYILQKICWMQHM